MERMNAPAVAAWFTETLKLPQDAAPIKEHEVDSREKQIGRGVNRGLTTCELEPLGLVLIILNPLSWASSYASIPFTWRILSAFLPA